MYKIINKQILAQDVKRLDVLAERIARTVQPGQFVMVTPDEHGMGIPLSVIEADSRRGIITLIIQETASETRQLGGLRINSAVFSIVGPFGSPTKAKAVGVVVCAATGIGTAQILPVCRNFKKAGNKVIGVIGARTKRSLMLEAQMRISCDKIFITTDDGSHERRGTATKSVKELIDKEDVNLVYATGSIEMMRDICQMTRPKGIRTLIQVKPSMLCGRGICGSCRCTVSEKTVLSCVEGPEFDGHTVDFEKLKIRASAAPSSGRSVELKQKIKKFRESGPYLSRRQSFEEARRCPQCSSAPCAPACPLGIDILKFIRLLREGDVSGALDKIKEQNVLPGVCGRLCPAPCEKPCVLHEKGAAVRIRDLERYAADFGEKILFPRKIMRPAGKRIAIIGSGPAGLTAAAHLARRNFQVTVFESMPDAGGALRYGIPEFCLPANILEQQIEKIKSLGVEIKTNGHIGQSITLNELFSQGFSSILLAVGAGKPRFPDISGTHLGGVFFGEEVLMRANLARSKTSREKMPWAGEGTVAVIGQGRTALECARAAAQQAEDVSLVFEKTEEDLDIYPRELERAKQEGVKFVSLTRPLALESNENNCVSGIRCERMDFADPDSTGRWQIIPVPDSEFVLEADTVVVAVGNEPDTSLWRKVKQLTIEENGKVRIDRETGMTSLNGVFAAGGAVTGGDSLLDAMVSGKKAAEDMDRFLTQSNQHLAGVDGGRNK